MRSRRRYPVALLLVLAAIALSAAFVSSAAALPTFTQAVGGDWPVRPLPHTGGHARRPGSPSVLSTLQHVPPQRHGYTAYSGRLWRLPRRRGRHPHFRGPRRSELRHHGGLSRRRRGPGDHELPAGIRSRRHHRDHHRERLHGSHRGHVQRCLRPTTFTVVSATSITARVPVGATTGMIAVATPGGTATSAAAFTVAAQAKPKIVKLTPTAGKRGTRVIITGTAFGARRVTSVVKFGTVEAHQYPPQCQEDHVYVFLREPSSGWSR